MDSTNVSSSNTTVTFVLCGANEKLNIKQVGENQIGNEFKGEIKLYDNTEKDLKRKRRTIPKLLENKTRNARQDRAER